MKTSIWKIATRHDVRTVFVEATSIGEALKLWLTVEEAWHKWLKENGYSPMNQITVERIGEMGLRQGDPEAEATRELERFLR